MNKNLKKMLIVLTSIFGIILISAFAYEKSGMEPRIDKSTSQANAKENNQLEKKYMDKKNESNIDKISKDQNGYDISMKPAQDDENYSVVNPKKMKVYKKDKGKLVDITNKGQVSKYGTNNHFIKWTYKNDKDKPVKNKLKKDIGDTLVFDVTYDKAVKPNTSTKEQQFVEKQIHELNHKVEDKKGSKKEIKHNKKLLNNNKKWLKKIKNEKQKTHRYQHELRY